jgi:hypothetical protein
MKQKPRNIPVHCTVCGQELLWKQYPCSGGGKRMAVFCPLYNEDDSHDLYTWKETKK